MVQSDNFATVERTMQFFLLHGYAWQDLEPTDRAEIIESLASSPLVGDTPYRFGFVECLGSTNGFAGFLNQEWNAETTVYDEDKEPVVGEATTSHNLFFVVDLSTGICALQTTRFPRETGLSMDLARKRFFARLEEEFAAVGYPGVYNEPLEAEQEIGRETIWGLLTSRRVKELKVASISGASLRTQYPVFNPDPTPNEFYQDHIWARTAANVERVEMKASENGDLGQTREARALVSAAEVETMKYEDESGAVQTVTPKWNGRERVPTPETVEAPEQVDLLIGEVRIRIPANVSVEVTVSANLGTQVKLIP